MRVLVCVTGQKTCERLIREGADIAKNMHGDLSVVHVALTGQEFLGSASDGEALEYLYKISTNYDADMTVLRAKNVINTLVDFAKKMQAAIIVLGETGKFSHKKHRYNVYDDVRLRLPDVDVRVINA